MHIDLKTADLAGYRTQVCVVGAGAAGLTVARRLLALGHHVLLLESGGTDYERATSDLNAGDNVGHPYYELEHSRLRFFGGTAAIWGGRVAELDRIDFERRAWVPHSGWPFGYDELKPYYDEAWAALGLSRVDPASAARRLGCPSFDPDRLETRFWGFDDRPDRFAFAASRDLRDNDRCLVVTHATVTEVVPNPLSGQIEELVVAAEGRSPVRIQARAFVLAAGAIENARILLASRRHRPRGVGNDHDLVGRYFMEHPHARGGRIASRSSWQLLNAFGRSHRVGGQRVAALLAAPEQIQERLAMLNTSLTIAPRQNADARPFAAMRMYNKAKHDLAPTRLSRGAWRSAKSAVTALQMIADPARPWLLHRMGVLDLALLVRAEQAPNPDSRVLLTDEMDALGMPRVALDWRLSPIDKHSVGELVTLLSRECERLGLGRVEAADWLGDPDTMWRTDKLISAHPIGGYHHMGTTRMGNGPRDGVADGDGRVFGSDNLYLAGSSLFPTSGWANPTLTLMALGLRTADRLSRALGQPDAALETQAARAAGH